MDEIFVPINGYEDAYEVSNMGRIRSITRLVKTKKGHYQTHNGKYFTGHDNGNGYLFMMLHKDGASKHVYVHRAVAEHFIPNPYRKSQVNHIDGNKSNNACVNLEWVTPIENMAHAYENGLNTKGRVGKVVKQLTIEGELVAEYPSVMEAARKTGISRVSIAELVVPSKRRWERRTAGGYKWEYAE